MEHNYKIMECFGLRCVGLFSLFYYIGAGLVVSFVLVHDMY